VISRIRGTLLRREIGVAEVLTPGGVGYELYIPLGVFERLPRAGADVELRVYQVVRADGIELYGFIDHAERAIFAKLIGASGVGPKLALNILSAMPPERIVRAILERDVAALRRIPGLGAKKAEKLALELADRLDDVAATVAAGGDRGAPALEESVRALVALGYSAAEASAALRKVLDEQGTMPPVDLIRAGLAELKR
jgi:Holliday junction DNA helicase RuvA